MTIDAADDLRIEGQSLAFATPSTSDEHVSVVASTAESITAKEDLKASLTAAEGALSWNEESTEASITTADTPSALDIEDAAIEQNDAIRGLEVAEMGANDLNALWSNQAGGLESSYSITEGGTYALTRDLETKSMLIIDAPEQDVTLKLEGHELKITGKGDLLTRTMINIKNARTVSIEGASSAGASRIISSGDYEVRGIACAAKGCQVSLSDVELAIKPKDRSQTALNVQDVYATAGSLSLTRCTLTVDLSASNTNETSSTVSANTPTSCVYATSSVQNVVLDHCSATCIGSPAVTASEDSAIDAKGNVFCLYTSSSNATVKGGTFHAESALGNASCLRAKKLAIEEGDEVTLKANAGSIASGVLGIAARSVSIAAPLSFSTDAYYLATCKASAVLHGRTDRAFVLGNGSLPSNSQTYPALVMGTGDFAHANTPGKVIAQFEETADDSLQLRWQSVLANAIANNAASTVECTATQAAFALDEANAVAKVNGTPYATIAEAASAFDGTPGQTLTLLRDASDITLANTHSGTIDLQGNAVNAIEYAATGNEATATGLVVKNGSISGGKNFGTSVQREYAAFRHKSSYPVALQQVGIDVNRRNLSSDGILADSSSKGLLNLTDCTINVCGNSTSSSVNLYGVNVKQGSQSIVSALRTNVHVEGTSVNVSAIALSAPAGAAIERCALTARSIDAGSKAVGGIVAGGTVVISNTSVNASVSADAPIVYGVSTFSNTISDISLNACSVAVSSDSAQIKSLANSYWCLRTAVGSSKDVSWTLSGKNAFKSASSTHVGPDAEEIRLSSDFDLDTANGNAEALIISQSVQPDDVGVVSSDGADITGFAAMLRAAADSYYASWNLSGVSGDPTKLAWKPSAASTQGAVVLKHSGSADRWYNRISDALGAAESGDTLQIACNGGTLIETGAIAVAQNDLTIDLNGCSVDVRAYGVTAGENGTGAALRYQGSGTLNIIDTAGADGRLILTVGSPTESDSGVVYQGVWVGDAGTLSVAEGCAVEVKYDGATRVAQQRTVELRGVTTSNSSLQLDGTLSVEGARYDGGIGATKTVGVFTTATAGNAAHVTTRPATSHVIVSNTTAAPKTDRSNYSSSLDYRSANPSLRELKLDPVANSDVYDAIQKQFAVSASYDDPAKKDGKTLFGTSIYYTSSPVVLSAPGEWYDGLKVWAYSDVVPTGDVGKLISIKASHFFVQAPYDTPTEAYGIQSSADSEGNVNVEVGGEVSCSAPYGAASALNASGSSLTSWTCDGATLSARSDSSAHPIAGKNMDLRDFIDLPASFDKPVTFLSTENDHLTLVEYESQVASGVSVSGDAKFKLAGTVSFSESGGYALDVQANQVSVADGFATSSIPCTVEARDGNVAGETFATPADSDTLAAGVFADAAQELGVVSAGDGSLAWGESGDKRTIEFKVGEALVARYVDPGTIDLGPLASHAAVTGNLTSKYVHTGWTSGSNAFTAPELPSEGSFNASGVSDGTVYQATFSWVPANKIAVSFDNVHDTTGSLVSANGFTASYGQTLGDALAAASTTMPEPADYVDATSGLMYRFVGWHDNTTSTTTSYRSYNPSTVRESLVFDSDANGVTSGSVVLRAVYVPVAANQRLVVFQVDHMLSAYAADVGTRPAFSDTCSSSTSLSTPNKIASATGLKYTFEKWTNAQTSETFDAMLPFVTAEDNDLTYIASFSEKGDEVKDLAFSYYYLTAGGSYSREPRSVASTYDYSVQEQAEKLCPLGSQVGIGGSVLTMEGWSLRSNDVEPVFTASNPIPSGSKSNLPIDSSMFSKTYYAVYSSNTHIVHVTFYDGATAIGSADVASGKSISAAFAQTGAAQPANRSETSAFLGWSPSSDATEYKNPETAISSLVSTTDTNLSLYAVFGTAPTYRVVLHVDQSQKPYEVYVKRNSTINTAFAKAGIKLTVPEKEGAYFAGWRSTTGAMKSLDDPVTGTAELYATYKDVNVTSNDSNPAKATVTCKTTLGLEQASAVTLSVNAEGSSCRQLTTGAEAASYSPYKAFMLRLSANVGGTARTVTGSFGKAVVKLFVGQNRAGMPIRVFWVGGDNTTKVSALKAVDENGYIEVSIGDYQLGDITEGGNLLVAIDQRSALSSGLLGGMNDGSALGNSSLGSASLGSADLGSASLSSASLDGGSGLSDGAASASLGNGAYADAGGNGVDMSELDGTADADQSPLEALFEGWDSNAAALLALIAAAIGGLSYFTWWIIAKRRNKQEEDEDDLDEEVPISPLLIEGIRF